MKKSLTLSKQILFLTKIFMTFLIISVLIFINFIDLQENNNNRIYLIMLKDIAERNNNHELMFKDYELKRVDTLKTTSPNIFQTHYRSRVVLVDILETYGAIITSASKGGGNKNKENRIILMVNDSLKIKLKQNGMGFLKNEETSLQNIKFNKDVDIREAINIFNTFPSEERVELIMGIDTIELMSKCDSIIKEIANKRKVIVPTQDTKYLTPAINSARTSRVITIENQSDKEDLGSSEVDMRVVDTKTRTFIAPSLDTEHRTPPINSARTSRVITTEKDRDKEDAGTGGGDGSFIDPETGTSVAPTKKNQLFGKDQTFEGLYIDNNQLFISVIDKKANVGDQGNGNQGSTFIRKYSITIPIKTAKITLPSTLILAGYPAHLIQTLSDKNKQEELTNLYGNAKLNMIDNISVDLYKKNNEPISILGFDLSRKWFPIALFIILPMVSLNLFNVIKISHTSSLLTITEGNEEDALNIIIVSKFIRFFLWVISPSIIFFLVLYSAFLHYSHVVFIGLLLCCILSTILGIVSYIRSLQL